VTVKPDNANARLGAGISTHNTEKKKSEHWEVGSVSARSRLRKPRKDLFQPPATAPHYRSFPRQHTSHTSLPFAVSRPSHLSGQCTFVLHRHRLRPRVGLAVVIGCTVDPLRLGLQLQRSRVFTSPALCLDGR
jgi:hypothetical protein